jgi:cyclase
MSTPPLKKIGDGVYAWIGANGDSNAGAVVTPNGLLAIDAQQTKTLGRSFRSAIEAETGRATTLLIDTHFHLDHTAGNIAFADIPIVAQDKTLHAIEAYLGSAEDNRWLVSDPSQKLRLLFGSNVHELVPPGDPLEQWFLRRISGPDYDTIELVGPSETFGDQIIFQRPEGMLHADYWGPAHCDGDLILHVPRQKVAFLGDLLFVGRFPWLGDCDLGGWIARLDRILALDIDTVVPGHGGLSTLTEVAGFRDMLATLRAAVQGAVSAGLSEDATVYEIEFPQYATMPRYREWLPPNLRAVYRYLKQRS